MICLFLLSFQLLQDVDKILIYVSQPKLYHFTVAKLVIQHVSRVVKRLTVRVK